MVPLVTRILEDTNITGNHLIGTYFLPKILKFYFVAKLALSNKGPPYCINIAVIKLIEQKLK